MITSTQYQDWVTNSLSQRFYDCCLKEAAVKSCLEKMIVCQGGNKCAEDKQE